MASSVDPDQTAPIGAVCSGSTLFASTLNLSVILGNYLQQTTSADDFSRHFQVHFFLGALRVNSKIILSLLLKLMKKVNVLKFQTFLSFCYQIKCTVSYQDQSLQNAYQNSKQGRP